LAAKGLENAGEYDAARAALGDLWSGFPERPEVAGLPAASQAEVLLRAGTLSGWLGSARQIPGAQEFAKDLISESIRAFEALGDREKVAEAQTDLAICYWREGGMDEARVWFREASSRAKSPANQLRALVNSTIVEVSSNRLGEALRLLDRAAPLLEQVEDASAKGRYYMQRGIVLRRLGGTENLDCALIENAAARGYFEEANHWRYFARVENNTGMIFLQLGRHSEALEHLDHARAVLVELEDFGTVAQVNETRARVFLALERYAEAEKIAFNAVSALEKGGEQSLLAEALITQGVALARLGRRESAHSVLKHAAEIAATAGDPESSGNALLTIIEELSDFLAAVQIKELYEQADRQLGDRLDAEIVERLRACIRLLLAKATSLAVDQPLSDGSLEQEMGRYEAELIREALDQARGSVTRAAKLLGLSHQGLCYIINTRHKKLLEARKPVRVRRKPIIRVKPGAKDVALAQSLDATP
jgi:tetratricopeptide (TPR) repeat protein